MRMLKRVLLVLVGLVVLMAAILAANTARQGSRQLEVPPAPPLAVDTQRVAETLAGAVRFRTIASQQDASLNAEEFRRLHGWLEQRFPLVHARLKREVVGGLSLLYTWPGSDPAAHPIALMAHQDVVPIEPGTEGQWQQPPFGGDIRDGYIWGRGTWDDKGNLVAQLQAVEMLLAEGFQPRQTVYIVSGADEEVSGLRGAQQVARLLQERKVRLEFVLDEGLFIGEGLLAGVAAPIALVGVAEKGYLTVSLKAHGTPGHASAPPPPGQGAIAALSGALQRLDAQQLPASIRGVAREMFETLAPEMGGVQRVALSNLWLSEPLVKRQLERSGSTNAMLRTTTALTVVQGGNKDNVIPGQAEALVNFRILPGETRETVLRHVRDVAGPQVEIAAQPGATDPTGISSTHSAAWHQINRTLRAIDPRLLVTPALFVAGSDSHHFTGIADDIYRFSPVHVRPSDLPRLHGTNERISLSDLAGLVRFYHQLLRNLNAPSA